MTGARRDRIVPAFVPVLNAAVRAVEESDPLASLTLYGSVATGQAQIPFSDVDLLAIGLPAEAAQEISEELARRFRAVCRDIAIATHPLSSLVDASDRAYGDRVFLRHYAVPLSGIDHARGGRGTPRFEGGRSLGGSSPFSRAGPGLRPAAAEPGWWVAGR